MIPRVLQVLTSLGVALVAFVLPGSAALAAGSGYYSSGPPPPSASSAGFTAIDAAQTIGDSGGTVSANAGSAQCTVSIPAGAFPNGGEVVISSAPPSALDVGALGTVIADCSVVVVDPNTGSPLPGPFSPALAVTVAGSAISSSSPVVNVSAPGVASVVPGVSATDGQVVVSLTTSSNLCVLKAPATSPASGSSATQVSGSALAVTGVGVPLYLVAALGFVLLIAGLVFHVWTARHLRRCR